MLIIFPRQQAHEAKEIAHKESMPTADAMREQTLKQVKQHYGNTPKVVHGTDVKGHENKFDWAIVQKKPRDWEFMAQSAKTLANLPETWTAYASDEGGRMGIIQMEYGELMKAQTKEEKMRELVHVASACLHLWRLYAGIE